MFYCYLIKSKKIYFKKISGIQINVICYSDLAERIYDIVLSSFYVNNFDKSIFQEVIEITYNDLIEYETVEPMRKLGNILSRLILVNITNIEEELKVNFN